MPIKQPLHLIQGEIPSVSTTDFGQNASPIAQPGTEVVAETGEGPFSQAISVGGRMNSYQWA